MSDVKNDIEPLSHDWTDAQIHKSSYFPFALDPYDRKFDCKDSSDICGMHIIEFDSICSLYGLTSAVWASNKTSRKNMYSLLDLYEVQILRWLHINGGLPHAETRNVAKICLESVCYHGEFTSRNGMTEAILEALSDFNLDEDDAHLRLAIVFLQLWFNLSRRTFDHMT